VPGQLSARHHTLCPTHPRPSKSIQLSDYPAAQAGWAEVLLLQPARVRHSGDDHQLDTKRCGSLTRSTPQQASARQAHVCAHFTRLAVGWRLARLGALSCCSRRHGRRRTPSAGGKGAKVVQWGGGARQLYYYTKNTLQVNQGLGPARGLQWGDEADSRGNGSVRGWSGSCAPTDSPHLWSPRSPTWAKTSTSL
jgi:hypothetical protein